MVSQTCVQRIIQQQRSLWELFKPHEASHISVGNSRAQRKKIEVVVVLEPFLKRDQYSCDGANLQNHDYIEAAMSVPPSTTL